MLLRLGGIFFHPCVSRVSDFLTVLGLVPPPVLTGVLDAEGLVVGGQHPVAAGDLWKNDETELL